MTALHRRGAYVICYLSAGSFEDWRSDAGRYPASVLGRPLDGWPGERWVDVRRTDVLLPILRDRIARCRAKGFDKAVTLATELHGWRSLSPASCWITRCWWW